MPLSIETNYIERAWYIWEKIWSTYGKIAEWFFTFSVEIENVSYSMVDILFSEAILIILAIIVIKLITPI